MGEQHSQGATGGLSRRDLLKRSAVAGGIVWAAPSVFASAAGATGGTSCPEGSCPVYHVLKINTDEDPLRSLANFCPGGPSDGYVSDASGFNGLPQCGLDSSDVPEDATIVATNCGTFQSHVQSITASGSNDVVVLKPGYQFVRAISKKGDCVESIAPGDCSTASFRNDSSHIQIIYCGPN